MDEQKPSLAEALERLSKGVEQAQGSIAFSGYVISEQAYQDLQNHFEYQDIAQQFVTSRLLPFEPEERPAPPDPKTEARKRSREDVERKRRELRRRR